MIKFPVWYRWGPPLRMGAILAAIWIKLTSVRFKLLDPRFQDISRLQLLNFREGCYTKVVESFGIGGSEFPCILFVVCNVG